jgi:hypothetical protein
VQNSIVFFAGFYAPPSQDGDMDEDPAGETNGSPDPAAAGEILLLALLIRLITCQNARFCANSKLVKYFRINGLHVLSPTSKNDHVKL